MPARTAEHTDHTDHAHHHHHHGGGDVAALRTALGLISAFMVVEIVAGLLASSLALLSDAAHMLMDAVGLALSLLAARLAARPAAGAMTFGFGRAEILSAQANGLTLLILALLIVYGAVAHLISPPPIDAAPVLAVALAGIPVNLAAARVLHQPGDGAKRSLNVEGSYRHILTDLFGFVATAAAAGAILLTGFRRADAIAALMIAALMILAAVGLLRSSMRVMMEAAPAGLEPERIGLMLAEQPGVVEVHDLHVWEVTSGFPALSAHVVVEPGEDCHELRRGLSRLLEDRFALGHTTLQVDHGRAPEVPLRIEVVSHERDPET